MASTQVQKSTMAKTKQAAMKETVEQSLEAAKVDFEKAVRMMKQYQARGLVMVKDPQFRVVSISTATGAVWLGSVGGAFGTASGIVVGTVAGALPALFTFGLSLPIGAVVGGSTGLCVGTAAGTGTGAFVGGAAGFGGFKYRVEINNGLVTVKKKALQTQGQMKLAASSAMDKTKSKIVVIVDGVKQRGVAAGKFTRARAGELAKLPEQAMASDKFKVTAASGAAGAIVGGGTGAVMGTAAGAAVGLIPALFTFGLSIPFCAVVGGCVGTASGTAVGATGGSAIGYGGYTYKKQIRSGAEMLVSQVKDKSTGAKKTLRTSAAKVSEMVKSYSSTGGTA